MDKQRTITVAAIVVLLGVVGTFAWKWRPANNPNAPDGVFYMCAEKNCRNEWNMTMRELSDHHSKNYGQPVPCPKCGSKLTGRGQKCVHCNKLFPMSRDARPCPHCKKAQA